MGVTNATFNADEDTVDLNTELAPSNVVVGTNNAMISADEDLSLLVETDASDSSKAYLHLRPLRITKVTTKIYWNGYKYNRINKAGNGFECTYSSKTKSHKFQYDKSIMLTRYKFTTFTSSDSSKKNIQDCKKKKNE